MVIFHSFLYVYQRVESHDKVTSTPRREIVLEHVKFHRNELVGGFNHLEKYEFVNGKDDIPYEMENNQFQVPNHQPVICTYMENHHFVAG